jgi:hypothetical protein
MMMMSDTLIDKSHESRVMRTTVDFVFDCWGDLCCSTVGGQ